MTLPPPPPLLHIGNVQKLEMDLSIKIWLIFGQMVNMLLESFKTQSPLKEVPASHFSFQMPT